MSFVAARCTQCGAKIQIDDSKEAGICEFCGTAFITEKAINNYNNFIHNEYHIDNAVIQGGKSIDEMLANAEVFLNVHHDYDKAFELFQKCANEAPGDYRGWWGMVRAETTNFSYYFINPLTVSDFSDIEKYYKRATNVVPMECKFDIEKKWNSYINTREQKKQEFQAKKAEEERKKAEEKRKKVEEEIEVEQRNIELCEKEISEKQKKRSELKKVIEENKQIESELYQRVKEHWNLPKFQISDILRVAGVFSLIVFILCLFNQDVSHFIGNLFGLNNVSGDSILGYAFVVFFIIIPGVIVLIAAIIWAMMMGLFNSRKSKYEKVREIITNSEREMGELRQEEFDIEGRIYRSKSRINDLKNNSVQGYEASACGQNGDNKTSREILNK